MHGKLGASYITGPYGYLLAGKISKGASSCHVAIVVEDLIRNGVSFHKASYVCSRLTVCGVFLGC